MKLNYFIQSVVICCWSMDFLSARADWGISGLATNTVGLKWGNETNGYVISLSADKLIYTIGDKVELKLLVKNVGTNSINIPRSESVIDYDLFVSNSREIIHPSDEGKKIIENTRYDSRMVGGSYASNFVGPSKSEQFYCFYPLTEIYEIKEPGIYKISAARYFRTDAKNVRVESNAIVIRIDPSKD